MQTDNLDISAIKGFTSYLNEYYLTYWGAYR